ncbi:INO80 chromatin remodeling complex Ies1-like protein [Apiospora kogelbergensis]|uniref:INO80 chromatin remodeling complex Ies1-like protein n=1 Tax=Apiospora kogelbergensis TaxID=1337665 RepID=A0AAW0QS73_9PEZI
MEKSDNHPSHPAADQNIRQIRPLKKEDGEPLWRKDIQYDFLRAVFDDECKVFTNSYDITQREKQTFARLYIEHTVFQEGRAGSAKTQLVAFHREGHGIRGASTANGLIVK